MIVPVSETDGILQRRNEAFPVDEDPFQEERDIRRLRLLVEEENPVAGTDSDGPVGKHAAAVGVVIIIILVPVARDGDVPVRGNPEDVKLRRPPDITGSIPDDILDAGIVQISVQANPAECSFRRIIQKKPFPMRSHPEVALCILPQAAR